MTDLERLAKVGHDYAADDIPTIEGLIRAILAELREPSQEMTEAVCEPGQSRVSAIQFWQAMIDVILKEPQ